MNLKEMIKKDVYEALNEGILYDSIVVENPKDRTMGDYAIPCFTFSKELKKSPVDIANQIKENLNKDNYDKIEVVNGYLNVFLKRDTITKYLLNKIITEGSDFGNTDAGVGKNIVIDYSSPNIAKPFSMGHLRSTVIGNAIYNICKKNGYNVIGVNHLGDWGTQFGKMIAAYHLWGNDELIKENPIAELLKLYIRFHDEALTNKELEDEGRKQFKMLEDGDAEATRLWKWFKEESLNEFQKTYALLGVDKFDSYNGEAFYNDKMDAIIDELENKNLLISSEGAKIVELEDMPPALIKRSDGATLYITRDLATAFYRKNTYDFSEAIYVVGYEQTLHFAQLKKVISKMGYEWADNMQHVSFGMVLKDGKKMSTRKGKIVKLHDVLETAIKMAGEHVKKNPNLDIDLVSKQVGVGAVIFNDLKNYRVNDIEFNLEDILNFNGETGPYLQYTYARINSLLENKKGTLYQNVNISDFIWNLVFKLYNFSDIIVKAKENYDPSLIAKYALGLSQDYNKFYANERIMTDNEEETEFKLVVSNAVAIVLKECLRLLGIEAPEKM